MMESEVPIKKTKSKILASVLAFILGPLGVHRFYLGQWWGIVYILFAITGISWLVSFIEGNIFLFGSDEKWNEKYGLKSETTMLAKVLVFLMLVLPTILLIGITANDSYKEYQVKVAEQSSSK